jgi:hypothetical protein
LLPALVTSFLCTLEHFEVRTLERAAFFFMRVYARLCSHKKKKFRRRTRINAHKNHINLCGHKFMRVYATFGRHPLSVAVSLNHFDRSTSRLLHDSSVDSSVFYHIYLIFMSHELCSMA